MLHKAKWLFSAVVVAAMCLVLTPHANAQSSTDGDGLLTLNVTGIKGKKNAVALYGQVQVTNGVASGYCFVNTAAFRFGGNALACMFYLDSDLNLHTIVLTLGRYTTPKTATIAVGYITTTNYLDPKQSDTFGAVVAGFLPPYSGKILYTTGWSDVTGVGTSKDPLVEEWPVVNGFINPVPNNTPGSLFQ